MATEQHDVKTLNGLLETVVDSIDGFEQATKSADTSAFKGIFEEVIRDRRGLRGDLENAIRTAGGTPEEEGTMLASAHRVLMRCAMPYRRATSPSLTKPSAARTTSRRSLKRRGTTPSFRPT